MNKNLFLTLTVTSLFIFSSCADKMGAALLSFQGKMKELPANSFSIDPEELEIKGGELYFTISGSFPEKYMNRYATISVNPELRYGNGYSSKAAGQTFQGEKVKGDNQIIYYLTGGRFFIKNHFSYLPEMHSGKLYVTFNAKIGTKQLYIPDVELCDGINTTSELYNRAINADTLSDGNETENKPKVIIKINDETQIANIGFRQNSSNLNRYTWKQKEMRNFIKKLLKIKNDTAYKIKSIDISAYKYSSIIPELTQMRKETCEYYIKSIMSAYGLSSTFNTQYIEPNPNIINTLAFLSKSRKRTDRATAENIKADLRSVKLVLNYTVATHSSIKAPEKADYAENLSRGYADLKCGNYKQAVTDLKETDTNAEGLAKILTKDYKGAAHTLDLVKNPTAITEYLHAIAMARLGNKYAANSHLKDALKMEPSLKQYADEDIEFKNIR